MSLAIVGYPQLAQQDAELIRSIRTQHQQLSHSAIAPHFTLVFPQSIISESQLAEHVRKQLAGCHAIQFVLRSSILVKDDSSDSYFVLLVPDEGLSSIVKLHDK